jgi:hypothetical protein
MSTREIICLSREEFAALVRGLETAPSLEHGGPERRRAVRHASVGTVETANDGPDDEGPHAGFICNINEGGLGMRCDGYWEPGTDGHVVIHLPQASIQMRVRVRYCERVRGQFMTGLEFLFDD